MSINELSSFFRLYIRGTGSVCQGNRSEKMITRKIQTVEEHSRNITTLFSFAVLEKMRFQYFLFSWQSNKKISMTPNKRVITGGPAKEQCCQVWVLFGLEMSFYHFPSLSLLCGEFRLP